MCAVPVLHRADGMCAVPVPHRAVPVRCPCPPQSSPCPMRAGHSIEYGGRGGGGGKGGTGRSPPLPVPPPPFLHILSSVRPSGGNTPSNVRGRVRARAPRSCRSRRRRRRRTRRRSPRSRPTSRWPTRRSIHVLCACSFTCLLRRECYSEVKEGREGVGLGGGGMTAAVPLIPESRSMSARGRPAARREASGGACAPPEDSRGACAPPEASGGACAPPEASGGASRPAGRAAGRAVSPGRGWGRCGARGAASGGHTGPRAPAVGSVFFFKSILPAVGSFRSRFCRRLGLV